MARAADRSGGPPRAAGSGSKPTNTSGRPVASSRSPNSPATSETGGRSGRQGPDGRRRLASFGQPWHGPDGRDVADQPDDEERLGHPGHGAADPVGGARGRRSRVRGRAPARSPNRWSRRGRRPAAARPDTNGRSGRQAVGARDERQRQHGEDAAGDGTEQPADLRQRAGAEAEEGGQDHQADGDEVDWVHVGESSHRSAEEAQRRPGRCGRGVRWLARTGRWTSPP